MIICIFFFGYAMKRREILFNISGFCHLHNVFSEFNKSRFNTREKISTFLNCKSKINNFPFPIISSVNKTFIVEPSNVYINYKLNLFYFDFSIFLLRDILYD